MRKIHMLIMSLFAVSMTSQSFALPSNEVERVYYSDATYTKVVGYEVIMTCYGRPHYPTLEGQKTRYAKSFSTPCNSRLEAGEKDILDPENDL